MSETTVPEGWTTTDVAITETIIYTVAVTHPSTATAAEIATVGYDDYRQALHPDTTFPHTVGADHVGVAGKPHDGDSRWPDWVARRAETGPEGEQIPTAAPTTTTAATTMATSTEPVA